MKNNLIIYIMILISFITIISFLLMFLHMIIYKKMFKFREKNTPIECGSSMMIKFHLPFSIQFFFISILFLIFDIEISLIILMIQQLYFNQIFNWMYAFTYIIYCLLWGLYIEFDNNLIKWF